MLLDFPNRNNDTLGTIPLIQSYFQSDDAELHFLIESFAMFTKIHLPCLGLRVATLTPSFHHPLFCFWLISFALVF